MMKTPRNSAFAVAAHPDDIEFLMAGTLLLLGKAGFELHYMNVASGSCGTVEHPAAKIRKIRRKEAEAAARILGATFHPPIVDDLEIFYERSSLRKLAAIVREVQPQIMLIPSPQDYMEDHTNTCRLAVTAAFARGMRNFRTIPSRGAIPGEVALYHAMPHGLRDGLRKRVRPGIYIDTSSVVALKAEALLAHRSQKDWLDRSHGKGAYVETLYSMSKELGRMSGGFQHAEGWRPHSHLGFGSAESDPLREALQPFCYRDPKYFQKLEKEFSHVEKA